MVLWFVLSVLRHSLRIINNHFGQRHKYYVYALASLLNIHLVKHTFKRLPEVKYTQFAMVRRMCRHKFSLLGKF